MNSAKRAVQLLQLSSRQLPTSQLTRKATTGAPLDNVHPGYKKLKAKQEKFQVNDGLPVFLKGGIVDKVLYHTTVGLCAVGLGMTFKFYYDMAVPRK
ncbi:cytochrome c oxidase subunit 7A, mitochondrial-like [Schistocerca cancellata]|uniref:cytochrome c oxidase subunit 7A, mitochondrial-like n=1 Tax=Schistocerca cancellata TaxID=274614 RepID=UPI0021174300|nr:cytochrome c oxidase subunit 7A, mitochondrial-like [Schistocerca cancellata]